MKYIDAEKLAKAIEDKGLDCSFVLKMERLDTLALIDELQQEQQEVDLEKEIDECWQNWLSPSNQKEVEGVLPKTEFAMYARHFYELGKNSVPLPEDTVIFQKGIEEGRRLMMEEAVEGYVTFNYDAQQEGLPCATVIANEKPLEFYESRGFKLGDKVRIIVLPKGDKK